jgi:alcohol dehydrogenase (cytochrome c)
MRRVGPDGSILWAVVEDWAGVLSTAGGVVFTGDTQGNMLALAAKTGKTLWHTYGGGAVQSAPITYELDGRQYY